MVVSVSASLGGLEIVGLAGLDGAQTGSATHHVDDEAGQLGAGDVGDAFLLEADAGAGRGGHDHLSAAGSSIYHIDGRHFTFRLQDHHAGGFPRLLLGQRFQNFRLRGDRVAEVTVRANPDGGVGDGLVSLHKNDFFCHNVDSVILLYACSVSILSACARYTVRQASGQTIAHEAHPMQVSSNTCCT